MKKLQIFEPAMCCSTGLCGVGVNPELLRISTVFSTLQKNGISAERFNLNSAPQQFVTNQPVNRLIQSENGVEKLPATLVDGEIVLTGRYPTNKELISFLDLPAGLLATQPVKVKVTQKKSGGCNCKGGCC